MISKSSNMGKKKNQNLEALINALKQPVCWAPLLAIVLVLIGVRVPSGFAPHLRPDCQSELRCRRAGRRPRALHCEVLAGLGDDLEHVLPLDSHPCRHSSASACWAWAAISEPLLHARHGCGPAASSPTSIIISSRYNIYVKEGASTRRLHGCVRRHLPCCGSGSASAAVLPSIQPYIYI